MKGMDTSLVFAMIFTLIVIGLLVVFGFGQVTSMFCFNGIAQIDKAVKNLENEVQALYDYAEGTSKPFNLAIPSGTSICIINESDPKPNGAGGWLPNPDMMPIISEKIRLKNANVWINYNCGNNEQTYRIDHIRLARGQGSFCEESGGSIYLENVGYYVSAKPG